MDLTNGWHSCERENQWLDEAPYYIDTSFVPRGGHRRRKSMEPKALANNNGTLVTPMKPSGAAPREPQTAPHHHMGRRDSSAWMRTPSDRGDDGDADAVGEDDWDAAMLTPVPKTPAPETIARYAMEVGPETPVRDGYADELALDDEELLLRTAPPKQGAYAQLGQDVLGQKKDQGVMMRLMAARRKSLQFAPKIASPLKRAWD